MSAQPQIVTLTPEKYLTIERKTQYKSEYFEGEMFAMSGASPAHNQIAANVLAEIHTQLKKRSCRVFMSDMRVKVSSTGLYTYPDIVAFCDPPHFDDKQKDTLLNPLVMIEVLSDSTEAYYRGKKFQHYRTLESLQEYLLIAQDKCQIEHYIRQTNNQWLLLEINEIETTMDLPSIQCSLALSDIYDKMDFKTAQS